MRSSVIVCAIAVTFMLVTIGVAVADVSNSPQQEAVVGHLPFAVSVIPDIPLFETEAAAQRHCPSDTVVWLNTKSGIYHLKGERWYGNTKYGAYVCKKEADAAGDRETQNGQ
jgi:hypothetical protein